MNESGVTTFVTIKCAVSEFYAEGRLQLSTDPDLYCLFTRHGSYKRFKRLHGENAEFELRHLVWGQSASEFN